MDDWTQKLADEFRRDWRRTGLLVVLTAVGIVTAYRQFAGGEPRQAEAGSNVAPAAVRPGGGEKSASATVPGGGGEIASTMGREPGRASSTGAAGPRKVFVFSNDLASLRPPGRDPFVIDLDRFPPDPAEASKPKPEVKEAPQVDLQAEEQQRRKESEAAVLADASKLHLQSVMMADPPQAVVDKEIYRVGQRLGGFVLTGISANSVTLERDGFEVVLKME